MIPTSSPPPHQQAPPQHPPPPQPASGSAPPAATPHAVFTAETLVAVVNAAVKEAFARQSQQVSRVSSESPTAPRAGDSLHLFRAPIPAQPFHEQPLIPILPATPAIVSSAPELLPRPQWPRKFAGTDPERATARVWLVTIRAFLTKWNMHLTDNPHQFFEGDAILWYLHLADTAASRAITLTDEYAFEQFLQAFDPHYYDERLTISNTFHSGSCNMNVHKSVTRYTQKFDDLVRRLGDVSRTTIIEMYLKGLTLELRSACQFDPLTRRFWIDSGDYNGLVSMVKGKEVELLTLQRLTNTPTLAAQIPAKDPGPSNPGPSAAPAVAQPGPKPPKRKANRFLEDLRHKLQKAGGQPVPGFHADLTSNTMAEYMKNNKCMRCGSVRLGTPLTCPTCPAPKRTRK